MEQVAAHATWRLEFGWLGSSCHVYRGNGNATCGWRGRKVTNSVPLVGLVPGGRDSDGIGAKPSQQRPHDALCVRIRSIGVFFAANN